MNLKHYVLAGLVAMSFTGMSGAVNATAATYKTVPQSIRGYYVSLNKKKPLSMAISMQHIKFAISSNYMKKYSLDKAPTFKIKKVTYVKPFVTIYYSNQGTEAATFKKVNNRLYTQGFSFQKVNKSTYTNFLK